MRVHRPAQLTNNPVRNARVSVRTHRTAPHARPTKPLKPAPSSSAGSTVDGYRRGFGRIGPGARVAVQVGIRGIGTRWTGKPDLSPTDAYFDRYCQSCQVPGSGPLTDMSSTSRQWADRFCSLLKCHCRLVQQHPRIERKPIYHDWRVRSDGLVSSTRTLEVTQLDEQTLANLPGRLVHRNVNLLDRSVQLLACRPYRLV